MVAAFGFALIATGIVVLFVIGSRRAKRASPLKLKPTPPAPEETARRASRQDHERKVRQEERARWFGAIGFVARLLTYAALFLLLYSWAPKDISRTPLASLTPSDIIGTAAFIAFAVVLIRALFNPSEDEDVRKAWGWLGVVILAVAALAAIYVGTR